MTGNDPHGEDEFVTIIGCDADQVARTFRTEGLAGQHYAIVHRMGRHRFAFADGTPAAALLDGRPLAVATYARRKRA